MRITITHVLNFEKALERYEDNREDFTIDEWLKIELKEMFYHLFGHGNISEIDTYLIRFEKAEVIGMKKAIELLDELYGALNVSNKLEAERVYSAMKSSLLSSCSVCGAHMKGGAE